MTNFRNGSRAFLISAGIASVLLFASPILAQEHQHGGMGEGGHAHGDMDMQAMHQHMMEKMQGCMDKMKNGKAMEAESREQMHQKMMANMDKCMKQGAEESSSEEKKTKKHDHRRDHK